MLSFARLTALFVLLYPGNYRNHTAQKYRQPQQTTDKCYRAPQSVVLLLWHDGTAVDRIYPIGAT